MKSILIVGYGIVGKALHRTFPHSEIFDPSKGKHGGMIDCTTRADKQRRWAPNSERFDVAFICVPTPMNDDGSCDTSAVQLAIEEWSGRAGVFCIKSTVPPGFTETYARAGWPICMSPEFDGDTQHSNRIDDDFVIIGGVPSFRRQIAEAYKEVKPATFRINLTDSTTAELVKYAENAFLAMTVTFYNEWFRICELWGVDVDEWRELLLNDPRISRSHSFTYRDHPYYTSKCFDKDIPAIISACQDQGYVPTLLEAVFLTNEAWKNEAEIDGELSDTGRDEAAE